MKLNNKIYCDVCCKRIDNYTDPIDCITYGMASQERHYCKKHSNIGEKLRDIYRTNEDIDDYITIRSKIDEYDEKFKGFTKFSKIPMPPVKPPKKEKIQRIYEDDDFVIDLFPEEPMVRVSIFKNGHFKDEVLVKKSDYTGYLGSC